MLRRGFSSFEGLQNGVDLLLVHLAVPPARRVDDHRRTTGADLQTSRAGDLGVQAPIDDLLL
jgi:hypothetical protein